MQHFDDDMGEMFRKASADIRLRPTEDEWDKIQGSLLHETTLLPSIKSKGNNRNTNRLLMVAFFILGIFAVTIDVLTYQKTKKMEPELQQGIVQDGGIVKAPVVEDDPIDRRRKYHPIFQSSVPVVPKIPLAEDLFKTKYLKELIPVGEEELIQLELDLKLEPEISMYDIRRETGNSKIVAKPEDLKNSGTEKGIYGGIIAGPQFSQTKQQGFGNAGLSAGFIAGFQMNKKLSVESGLLISDKQFSSSGEYFDMSKISAAMPSGMKLIQIQSKTTVLEVPLELKWDFTGIGKGNLFATGGFLSYIITSESNQYQASVNGTHETMEGNYTKHQGYFAAAANIGAGYEWKAGKGLNLRLEPYLQIPLKKIGMGSMHVLSTGVYLGITFPIIK